MPTSVARLKTAIYAYLGEEAGLNIREYVGDRVSPEYANEDMAYPYITYRQVFGDSIQHFDGVSELAEELFQFDVWTTNPNTLDEVVHALRLDMDRWRGTYDSIYIRNAFLKNETDTFRGPSDGSELPVYSCSIDFQIWYMRDRVA